MKPELIHTIKKEWVAARKEAIGNKSFKIKANLLGTLIGEIEMVAKNDGQRLITDTDCVNKIKAFIKGIDQTIELCDTYPIQLDIERNILYEFLPKQMGEVELIGVIGFITKSNNATSPSDMGRVMSILKKEYDGLYDGKMASVLVKQALS
jgi:hypothetical protein